MRTSSGMSVVTPSYRYWVENRDLICRPSFSKVKASHNTPSDPTTGLMDEISMEAPHRSGKRLLSHCLADDGREGHIRAEVSSATTSGRPVKAVRKLPRYTNPAVTWGDLAFLREHTKLQSSRSGSFIRMMRRCRYRPWHGWHRCS